jgi:hypothetical protein
MGTPRFPLGFILAQLGAVLTSRSPRWRDFQRAAERSRHAS